MSAHRHLALTAAFALIAAALPANAQAPSLADAAGSYSISNSSRIHFSIGQTGGGGIAGNFAKFSGKFRIDGGNVSRSSVEFTLFPESVRARERRIENFLRSSAVFDTANFQTVTFRSTNVTQTGPGSATVEGALTARGKTRKERFAVTLIDWDKRSISFTIRGSIRRSPYGMDVGTPIYSNVVEFDMNIKGVRR
ncbi:MULTISPECIES: YceI family protein [Sinorhizobium]|uniref:Polyprenyl-pyrophosphate binding protein n=2 Tax=Sinorhizobium TaxID=28105 RepID=A0A2S3YW32_9HYPH|nr:MULTISPECIES: YceI family protein [Sinorhizobium]ASY56161.1 YceI [Sinorhizobium sp. CCBAU 05631]AUX76084.1 YceI-like domain-containing protein [Sinorhizobium fredii]PDT39929.1 polyisoprenoid-binding protein [Sinorhizobium sp. FG01]POH35850.1 polyprenyl-pyrophosphate binding protein [Sinorhizobium americanum]